MLHSPKQWRGGTDRLLCNNNNNSNSNNHATNKNGAHKIRININNNHCQNGSYKANRP